MLGVHGQPPSQISLRCPVTRCHERLSGTDSISGEQDTQILPQTLQETNLPISLPPLKPHFPSFIGKHSEPTNDFASDMSSVSVSHCFLKEVGSGVDITNKLKCLVIRQICGKGHCPYYKGVLSPASPDNLPWDFRQVPSPLVFLCSL